MEVKLAERIRLSGSEEASRRFFSLEVFPPSTELGMERLLQRIRHLAVLEPLFIDVTWNATARPADQAKSIEICEYVKDVAGVTPMLHLTAGGTTRAQLRSTLERVRAAGIRNILALRGDIGRPSAGAAAGDAAARDADGWVPTPGGLSSAADLVRFIRKEHGDYFCIAVAGHPEAAGQAEVYAEALQKLKEKIDAGAELVLSQFTYDAAAYTKFIADVRQLGIEAPVLPGVMPIYSLRHFTSVNRHCRCDSPPELVDVLTAAAQEDAAASTGQPDAAAPTRKQREVGMVHTVQLCRQLLDSGVPGLHFFTMNLDAVVRPLLEELGIATGVQARSLPWRRSLSQQRQSEGVRPIYWAHRVESYLARTASWSSYPDGRWSSQQVSSTGSLRVPSASSMASGRSSSPVAQSASAVGEELGLSLGPSADTASNTSGMHKFSAPVEEHLNPSASFGTPERRRAMWGDAPARPRDLWEPFARYISGDRSVPCLPWSEGPLMAETTPLTTRLASICRKGFLTINSQPPVNAARSDDPVHGWGGDGGYVYQKGYVEFFCSPTHLRSLLDLQREERFGSVSLMAVDAKGNQYGSRDEGPEAVTWGVFPGREVQQPTVVDKEAFLAWSGEAFQLWDRIWCAAYAEGTPAQNVVHQVMNSYFLVSVVDHDFIRGDALRFVERAAAGLPDNDNDDDVSRAAAGAGQ